MPSLSFDNIVKRYGAVTVVNDLNLAIEHGDFLVLLGPSGCGKTTLLNILAGLTDVNSGRVAIDDRDVTELEPRDRGLGMVFQSYALYPTKSVEGNLYFGLASSKVGKAEKDLRVQWAAKLLQLEPLLKRRPAELSGGQRQRVAIGRALVKHAKLLLFDEPLSNLDAKLRAEMRMEIKRLHETLRPTVVYVTHDQIEAMTLATKIAVMNKGVIQQFGAPDEIYERPANVFVAGFIGSPPMNLLPAKLRIRGGKPFAEAHDGISASLVDYPLARPWEDGAEIVLGLRPEHFVLGGSADPQAALSATIPITHIERTGSDAIVSLMVGPTRVDVRIDPSAATRLKVGDGLRVDFPGDRISMFDAKSGLRL